MSPDVLARKLERLAGYLRDLSQHEGRSSEDIRRDPYAVERLLELVVQVSVDIVAHLLAETGAAPSSYRDSFVEAGRRGLVPADLAQRLAAAASLRNILVHMYEQIDYDIIADSIGRAVHDFGHLRDVLAARLKDEP